MQAETFAPESFAQRRDRVHEAVIKPLLDMGMRKSHRMRQEDFVAFIRRLTERLVWLSAEWHPALVEIIARSAMPTQRRRDAGRPARNVWPDEVSIINWAHGLSPLVGTTRLVGTYMRSAAGRAAWDRSPFEADRLERYLRQFGRPPEIPGGFEIIARDAADDRVGFERTCARIAACEAGPKDQLRLDGWSRRMEYLNHLIAGDLNAAPELAA